jgi:adenylate cyclase
MGELNASRRLAAILAADVVGYSRMMGTDEAGTLAALKRHRATVFDPTVAEHNGRIVKLIGDGTIVEFTSVVDAVRCALAIQQSARADADPSGMNITLRIGINLGDIIIDGDDIYGDGVNIAARLEPLAEPGGVCIASIVNESVGSRIDVTFDDGGEVAVKNIDRPIRVWKWHPGNGSGEIRESQPVEMATPEPAEPRAQSIAVLPFDNMSHDPEQEYFSDGITEDIITDLSKVGGLMVIARNSSFAYKGKSPDIRAVGRELGVTSVLEGSIRRAGNRVRVTAQLIDAATGGHLWADRYDRDLTDIFEVQDEVTRQIVEALKVTLTPNEAALIADTPTSNLEAHDLFIRARELWREQLITKDRLEEIRAILERAIALDPDYGDPYAALAQLGIVMFNNNWTDDPQATVERAVELAAKATELAPTSSFAHTALATSSGFVKDFARSRQAIERALELNPNNAEALVSRGAREVLTGDPAGAIPDLERARRLDPTGTALALHFLGLAHLLLGKYETAAAYFKERILLTPGTDLSRVMLASTLGHLGETDEARRIWAELKSINPAYSFEIHMSRLPFTNPADVERIASGLGKAGLPG